VEVLRDASPKTHPRIVALGDDLLPGTPQDRLDWIFRVVVNGTLSTPR
jgi:hypothetical protein